MGSTKTAVTGEDHPVQDADQLTDALLTASRLLVALSARSIASVDETITIPQFRTLVILSTRGPSNVATIAGLLNVQPSTATRMVDRLVGSGLLDRRMNPNSRREQIVALTDRGRQVVDTAAGSEPSSGQDIEGYQL